MSPAGAVVTPRRVVGGVGLALLLVLLVLPHGDPRAVDLDATFAPPSWAHPLGTDQLGRDLWARVAAGLERTCLVVVLAGGAAVLLGVTGGLLAGLHGGPVRWVVRAAADAVLVVPSFVAALVLASVFGLTPVSAGLALGVFGCGPLVHQTQALVEVVARRDDVAVERLMGTPGTAVLAHQVLPAVRGPVLAYLGSTAAGAALAYAGLAFIGLGVDATTPDWGTMLYDYRVQLGEHPLLVLWPTLGIALVAVTCHALLDREPAR